MKDLVGIFILILFIGLLWPITEKLAEWMVGTAEKARSYVGVTCVYVILLAPRSILT